MKKTGRKILVTVIVLLLAGCAPYLVNHKLDRFDPQAGYRFQNLHQPEENDNPDSLFIILTFSGGGTRAAALSYGVMEKLRKTKIVWNGKERRLLDEVDVISSVSGGSFTAAYYTLFGDELFNPDKFEKLFLYRDIQADLVAAVLQPANWFRLAGPSFSRIDLAAELYDERIYEHKTFADLIRRDRRPFLMLNATDMTMGSPFPFTQDQFDLLCSDLAEVPVATAVAASSAFPVAFPPLILRNYANGCTNYREPAWMDLAYKDRVDNPPRFNRARIARSYANSEDRPYIHLLDGGVADNIGLRGPLAAIESNDPSWSLVNKLNNGKVKKLVVIVVDARTSPEKGIDKTARSPGLVTTLDTIASVPMGNYSFDTVQKLKDTFESWRKDQQNYDDCRKALAEKCSGAKMPYEPPTPVESYAIYVGFDQLPKDHVPGPEYFLNLGTNFHLDREDVNKLRAVGPEILGLSKDFRDLCAALNCHE